MRYPSRYAVKQAGLIQLQEWHEKLPVPSTQKEKDIYQFITERLEDLS